MLRITVDNISLRDYQLEMKSRLFAAWERHRSVMVQMPTGTGKTHVLAAVIRDFLQQSRRAEVWIIAHRRELVEQIEETVGRYGIAPEEGTVRVLSIQWLAKHWEDVGGRPALVVIDEAHHALAATYRELWRRYPEAGKLGLTATPCRMNRSGFTDLFDVLLTSCSIAEFIRKGRLSVFDYVAIRADGEDQRLIDSLVKRGADGDYQIGEMNRVLNRDISIGRLYDSVERFARGRKGIVYAISIDHARNISAYYSRKGVAAVAIDSRTPAAERRRLVEDFRAGRIRVLVNVDVFSEGFDCPDVEFVQLARPTLSLAKYLQQVGRGLRRTAGKEACVLIDNVGLYRVFGLPTVSRDWEAMFRGVLPGKGRTAAQDAGKACLLSRPLFGKPVREECGMEVIVSHERLLADLEMLEDIRPVQEAVRYGLKAWQDGTGGRWGLKRGRTRTTEAVYVSVFDIGYDLAAVRFGDNTCGVVRDTGEVVWRQGRCRSLSFQREHLLKVTATDGRDSYVDLYSLHVYDRKPEVKKFGTFALLKVGGVYYSRTREVYVNEQHVGGLPATDRKFYLSIFDYKMPAFGLDGEETPLSYGCGYACLLQGDYERYYWLYRTLGDGSIIVADDEGRYYQVSESGRQYVGCCASEEERRKCREEVGRRERQAMAVLQEQAGTKLTERRQRLLDRAADARPFCSGRKWGLRVDGRVTVPPVYRNVKSPVGRYCAVEKDYRQWGVVALDGTLVVEPAYADIEINGQGVVTGTKLTGRKVRIQLP